MSGEPGILLACDTLPENPWVRDRLPAVQAALADRQHEIVDIYDFGSSEVAHRVHRTKARGFFKDHQVAELNQRFRDRILASDCRIVVLGTVDNYSHFLLPETIRELREAGRFTVGILGDDEFTFERNWPYAFLFDRVIAYVKPMVDRYNALRPGCCLYLPNSCHFPKRDFDALQISEENKKHHVALFGSVFPARLRLVEKLAEAGIPLSLFGGKGWLESPSLRPYYRGFVPSDEFDRTVRESRLILALLEDHLSGAAHMNTKIWEAVRNGQMCLTTRYNSLVTDYGLVEDQDIVFYDSVDDLTAKIRHYLAQPNDRRKIARNLFEKVKQRFDYRDLYGELFIRLEQAVENPPALLPPVETPAVTLIGNPSGQAESDGFPVWRFRRNPGWRSRVAAEFRTRVRTSHVILTGGSFRFDRCLHSWLTLGPDAPGPGVLRLRSAGANTMGHDTLLWEAATFESVVLRGSWWQRARALAAPIGFPATRSATRCDSVNPIVRWSKRAGAAIARGYRSLWKRTNPSASLKPTMRSLVEP